jgi:hypothetical protein
LIWITILKWSKYAVRKVTLIVKHKPRSDVTIKGIFLPWAIYRYCCWWGKDFRSDTFYPMYGPRVRHTLCPEIGLTFLANIILISLRHTLSTNVWTLYFGWRCVSEVHKNTRLFTFVYLLINLIQIHSSFSYLKNPFKF